MMEHDLQINQNQLKSNISTVNELKKEINENANFVKFSLVEVKKSFSEKIAKLNSDFEIKIQSCATSDLLMEEINRLKESLLIEIV